MNEKKVVCIFPCFLRKTFWLRSCKSNKKDEGHLVQQTYSNSMLNYGIFGIVSQDLYIEKVCRVNLNFNSTICDNIQTYENEQIQVQEYTSTLKMYNTIPII